MREYGKVQVIMSAYNGEKYLREQIDSLLRQTWPNLEILIRDDGSKDETRSILTEYQDRYTNIRVFWGDNIGVTGSFFELLQRSDAEYTAFCDQDDVWLPEKIERAVLKIEKIPGACMYCSNKILVDEKLNVIGENTGQAFTPGFGNAVVECICTGCTIVMNRELSENIKQHIPECAVLHDWWTYLVASYLGKVVFDPDAYIYYRQHGGNEVGASNTAVGTVRAQIQYLKKSRGKLGRQLACFHMLYRGDMEKDILVENILHSTKLRGKWKIVFSRQIYRQKKLDGLMVRFLFLVNRML